MNQKQSTDNKVNGFWEACPFHHEDNGKFNDPNVKIFNGEFGEPDPQIFFTASDIKNEVVKVCPDCDASVWYQLRGYQKENSP